jgi:Protein of unknown function (DUF3822)
MKTLFKIGNSEELNPSQAVLLMEVGETHCCFAIVDFANQMMVQLAYYTMDEKDDENSLQTILETHPELRQSFRQTIVSYYLPESLLIPAKFYDYEETQKMLATMYEEGSNTVVSESISEWQVYNSYRIPSAIHEFLSRSYSTGSFWHTYSITLKNGWDKNEAGKMLVDFKVDTFSAILIRENSLQLAQIFCYRKAEDVLYWLLKICKQFSTSQNDVKIILSGLIDRQSAVFKELYQYFLNIEFASTENDIQLSRDFEEYPVHFFSSLYKLASCVS